MTGIYFSGTGNSKYGVEYFLHQYDSKAKAFSIEEEQAVSEIQKSKELVFGYPVQYSDLPKIVRDFVEEHQELWQGKRIFIIATMGMFSGDGAGVLARLLKKYGAEIIGGLHLKMPDSISDEKVLKRSLEENKKLINNAERKIIKAVEALNNGISTREGMGAWSHLAGLFGQRLYFGYKTKHYTDKLKIDRENCVGCGKCVMFCPMKNIKLEDGVAVSDNRCTMCYRCVNHCPKQAITLLGRRVVEQISVEKFL